MTGRQRWFCQLCGAMTGRKPGPDGRVSCLAHSRVSLDELPADPIESRPLVTIPTRSRVTCAACNGSGVEFPDSECFNCDGRGFLIRQPSNGLEA